MTYLPIFFETKGRPCLVVGGGSVALRKAQALVEAGAVVTVISPEVVPGLKALERRRAVRRLARRYARGDVRGFALVYVATDDAKLQSEIASEAREIGIAVNVADVPELCTFISPSVVSRGALTIAIATAGASPAMARRIRERLERQFGDEYVLTLEVHRAARRHLRTVEPDPARRALRMTRLAASTLPARLRRGDVEGADRILLRHVGVGLKGLGFGSQRLRPATETTAPQRSA